MSLPNELVYSIIVGVITLIMVPITSCLFGLTENERQFVLSKIPILRK